MWENQKTKFHSSLREYSFANRVLYLLVGFVRAAKNPLVLDENENARGRDWPFTFFVNTDSISTSKLFVTWKQLREMSKHGVTIANHTSKYNHLLGRGKNETDRQWRVRITAEITSTQLKIKQETGNAPNILTYPFGEYGFKTMQAKKEPEGAPFLLQRHLYHNTRNWTLGAIGRNNPVSPHRECNCVHDLRMLSCSQDLPLTN